MSEHRQEVGRPGAVVAILAALMGCGEAGDLQTMDWPVIACTAEEESRWLSFGEYVVTGSFGVHDDEIIERFQGASYAAGRLFVLDIGAPAVLEFDPGLELVRTIGRRGAGPGEFMPFPATIYGDWITGGAQQLWIYDGQKAHEFSSVDGQYLSSIALPRPDVRRIAMSHQEVQYAIDHQSATGERSLGTYRVGAIDSVIATFAMPPLPKVGARHLSGGPVDQSQPLWAVRDGCHAMSDGSALLYIVRDTTADTVRLPLFEPPPDAPEDETNKRRMAQLMRLSAADLQGVEPTSVARYSELLIDPDGAIWLVKWAPYSRRYDPVDVVVFTAAGTTEVTLPGTPVAFGEPGVMYVVRRDSLSDVAVLLELRVPE